MKISIILPVFNPGNKIIETIESVLSQTYCDYELIIQDGSESHNVEKLIRNNYSEDNRIVLFHEPDKGVYDAMNKGIQHASGEYAYFIGAGDRLHDKNVLHDISKAIEENNYDIVYGYVIEIDNGQEKDLIRLLNWKYILKFTPVCHQAVFSRIELLRKYQFDIMYNIAADQDWLLKMKKLRKSILFVNRAIAYYPLDGISSNNEDIFVKEQKEIHGRYYPFWKSVRYTWRKIIGKDKW